MTISLGVDVSSYQGPIDWDAVGRTPYRFGLARMTIGRGTRDDLSHRNLSEMVGRVAISGAYGVVGITEPVTDGAKFLLDEIAADVDPTKILVMLDAENFSDGSHPTIDQVDQYAIAIHDRLGRWPIAYVPGWWMRQHGYTAAGRALANCPWAPSHYLAAPWTESKLEANKPTLAFGFKSLAWLQYTSSASVSGISGRVDANVFYGTLTQLKAQLLGQPAQEETFMALTDSEEQEILKAARQINGAVGAGQPSYSETIEATLSTVQGLVNLVKGAQGNLAAGIADVRSAVLGAVAALPAPETPEQAQAATQQVLDALANLGIVGLSPDAVLDALSQRLAA